MNSKKERRYKKMCSDRGLKVVAPGGEPIRVKIDEHGGISLSSALSPDNGGLGAFQVTGLTPQKVASKKKRFWRKLWKKIKDVAGAVLDAITVPIFGYKCRPDISIDFRGREFTFGIKCHEVI